MCILGDVNNSESIVHIPYSIIILNSMTILLNIKSNSMVNSLKSMVLSPWSNVNCSKITVYSPNSIHLSLES